MREAARKSTRRGGGVARADDRDGEPVEQAEIALGRQQWRGIVELGQQTWIEALADRQKARSGFLDDRDFTLGLVASPEPRRRAAAAPREVGNGSERFRCAAEARDQLAIC